MDNRPLFTLDPEADAADDDDVSDTSNDVDDFVKKLDAAAARAQFHKIADDEDPYCPGQKIPPGMRKVCVMFRASEKDQTKIDAMTGLEKIFATFGRDVVTNTDKLEQELHGARPLADVYIHGEIVLHNLTRWRIINDDTEPDGTLVQLIKLDSKGLPMARKFRSEGRYEPVARYVVFFLFLVPAERHDALEQWCKKLYDRRDSYDLKTTTINSFLRLADLYLFEKLLLRRGRNNGCFCLGNDDEDYDIETLESIRERKPVRVLQSSPLAGKVKWNCCTLLVKSLKILGILTEEDVPKWLVNFFNNMDVVRLLLSKTLDINDSKLKKWKASDHFVISKELYVTWRTFKTKEEREKAEKVYTDALAKQHRVGLAAADEAMTTFLQKCKAAKSAAPSNSDDEDNDEEEDAQQKAPLLTRQGRIKK